MAYSVQTPREKPTQRRVAAIQTMPFHRADEASEAELGWLIHAAVIVGDINLIAQLLISSQGTSAAEAVFPRDLDWIAPVFGAWKCKIFS